MHEEAPTPSSPSQSTARLDRLGAVLAAVTAVIGAAALIGGSEETRRGNSILLMVAVATFTGGVGLLFAFRDTNTPRRLRPLRSVATVALLAISLVAFGVLISRAELTDSRPVITATATGDGPLTISGSVTAGGLGSTERVAIKFVDADAIPFQAVAGTGPEVGRATIPFKVRVNSRPDREITIVAWLVDRVAAEPTCAGSAPVVHEVTCVHMTLNSQTTVDPVLTLTPSLTPGARTVTVALTAIVAPNEGVQVNLWDRSALLQTFIARPGADGKVDASAVVPIQDDKAVLCAVAEIVAQATTKNVPSPCIATTFVQMTIPSVPGLNAATPAPRASAAPGP